MRLSKRKVESSFTTACRPAVHGGRPFGDWDGSGDPTQRGVAATASYEAREFGIQSGVPLRLAAKRCPEACSCPRTRQPTDEFLLSSWPRCPGFR
jgi:nucleotidyltransferase/DNA polymerase involved in DNA repair